jgi:anti-sigma factor RsiW
MTDRWTDRLSEYLDGDLAAPERAELETHISLCEECADTLEALRAVAERAQHLETPALTEDLWPGIEARIGAESRPRIFRIRPNAFRFTVSLPQAAAAALALTLLSGGAMWWAMRTGPLAPPKGGAVATQTPGATTPATLTAGAASAPGAAVNQFAGFDATHYDTAIADLERMLTEHRSQLDTSTVRVVEQNLVIIDHAIEQARRALAADPASPYLNGHLAQQLKLKLDLLRRATDLPGAHG